MFIKTLSLIRFTYILSLVSFVSI